MNRIFGIMKQPPLPDNLISGMTVSILLCRKNGNMPTNNIKRRGQNPAVITGETVTFMNKWKSDFASDVLAAQQQIVDHVAHTHKLVSVDEARGLERMALMNACLNNARCYSLILAFANTHLEAILHTNTQNMISELMGCIDLQFDQPKLPEIIKQALIKLADQLLANEN